MVARDQPEQQQQGQQRQGQHDQQPLVVPDPRGRDGLFDTAHPAWGRWWNRLVGVARVHLQHLVGTESDVLGIGSQGSTDEDVARQRLEVFAFESGELVDPELGIARRFLQGLSPDQPRPRKRRADPDRVLQGCASHGVGTDDSPSGA